MNTQVFRAIRVLVPSDLRLIWRDGFLLSFLIFVLPLAAAPRLVLCSDGISGMLDHEQMRGVLAADADPGRAADALLAAALDAGGRDNATVVVVLEQRLGVLP